MIALLGTLAERQSLLIPRRALNPLVDGLHLGLAIDWIHLPVNHKCIMDWILPRHQGLRFMLLRRVVSHVGYESGYGKLVSIDHGYGVVTRYAHNSQVFVEVGQRWVVAM